ncbi:FtsW/RodA/SpoVE family cell cycle protein [Propioniciclava soli]|uniref:FtsW/RodA/SpoVE family cell cycle protein n=1 Tax=Propioniciclava soli TaxID=2775081 RepID=UPI001E5960EC|nr:FtsW/RodA/SpoVE family cell cycle protein [Propioniciclava soli]
MSEVVVRRQRSVASLLMMLLALALGASGYLLVHLNQDGALPPDWLMSVGPLQFSGPWYVGVGAWFALGLVAWGVTKWRLPYADPIILPLVFLLTGLGISMIHRLDQADSLRSAELQLLWLFAAVTAYCVVVVALRDHRRLQRYTYVWFLAGLALLLMPLLPVLGRENHGARIWIAVGPFSFQPSELAKIILAIAFAAYLVEKRDVLAMAGHRFLGIDLPRPRDLGPIGIAWGVALLILVFQRDLGTTLLFFGLFVMMLYTATERVGWAVLGLLLILVLGFVGYEMFDHVQTRFASWLHPFTDYDRNLQVISAQFGLAWGGLFGTGWGEGRPYLTPLAKNDFIAAALGEELGLVGFCAVVLLYGLIVARVLRTALAATEPFGKLLAAGVAFVFALQVFTIIGGVTRLLPLTGVTTPFVSQGGSSLIANYILAGVMLTITHQARRPQVAPTAEEYASLSADPTQALPAVAAPRPDPADFADGPSGATEGEAR